MPTIFLSHNSKDKPIVEALARALMEVQLVVWFDKYKLVGGDHWQTGCRTIVATRSGGAN